MKRPDGQTVFLGSALLLAVVAAVVVPFVWKGQNGQAGSLSAPPHALQLADIPFDGEHAYRVLTQLCEFGPRYSGSEGMQRQQQYLEQYFEQLGGQVEFQRFRVRHPLDGSAVPMANLIVRWHPDRAERILLCAHYDTRPFPDRDPDPRARRGRFVGANDGASGVAVLAEMGRWMERLGTEVPSVGIDFVLFDGEELVYDDQRDPYFLGSRYFARQYVAQPPDHRYRVAVLFDMVGDRFLQVYQERFSMRWRDTRPFVHEIWRVARQLGVREFIPRTRHEIRDDHVMLHDVGGIPALNIIDFDYGPPGGSQSYWHTRADTPDKCSPLSLAKVGWVVLTWLRQQE